MPPPAVECAALCPVGAVHPSKKCVLASHCEALVHIGHAFYSELGEKFCCYAETPSKWPGLTGFLAEVGGNIVGAYSFVKLFSHFMLYVDDSAVSKEMRERKWNEARCEAPATLEVSGCPDDNIYDDFDLNGVYDLDESPAGEPPTYKQHEAPNDTSRSNDVFLYVAKDNRWTVGNSDACAAKQPGGYLRSCDPIAEEGQMPHEVACGFTLNDGSLDPLGSVVVRSVNAEEADRLVAAKDEETALLAQENASGCLSVRRLAGVPGASAAIDVAARTCEFLGTMAAVGMPAYRARGDDKAYYELELLSEAGALQFGWADAAFEGRMRSSNMSVGDDAHSWAFDGDRQLLWHRGANTPFGAKARRGDVVGLAVDMRAKTMHFSVNGSYAAPNGGAAAFAGFECDAGGVFPAFSAVKGAKVRWNFGSAQFKYAPPGEGYAPVSPAEAATTEAIGAAKQAAWSVAAHGRAAKTLFLCVAPEDYDNRVRMGPRGKSSNVRRTRWNI